MITAPIGGTKTGPAFAAATNKPDANPFSLAGNQLFIEVIELSAIGASDAPSKHLTA